MKALERFFERSKNHFMEGGRYAKLYPLYEAVDTFLFTPAEVTHTGAHVRDALDLKRTMITVVVAMLPCILMALYNTGLQAHLVIAAGGGQAIGWRAEVMAMLGLAHDPSNLIANTVYGALFFIPIWLVTNVVGGLWEGLFAMVRKHEINEGFLVTGWLYPLILPPTMPLWQVALGISFGVVFGKEIFGGTGKNIFNPALMGRAFVFFAFPAQVSGDLVWTAVDGYSGATPLAQAAAGGLEAITYTWSQAFWGFLPGSMGETSAVACLFGAVVLAATGIGSWRIMVACTIGMAAMTLILNQFAGPDANPMLGVPVHWHAVLGSFAFAVVFMATDPVSAAMTNTGRWIYGILIGIFGIAIRVSNPAFPEGWMLAILFMNAFAPTIDFFVMRSNIKRRVARNA